MSIHQTNDGRWFVAYRVPGARSVKRQYFARGPEGKLEAKKWEADYLDQRQKRPVPLTDPPAITFVELAQRYFAANPLAFNTHQSMVYALNSHVLPRWGEFPVASLTMAHLNEVDQALVASGRSLATRNRYRTYCKVICQWGVKNDLVEQNPFAKFRPEIKKEAKAPDLITEDELRLIFQSSAPHLQWAIEVMINTGVRPGPSELFDLKMSDIDFKKDGLWVKRRKTHDLKPTLLPLRPEFMARLKALAAAEPERQYLVEYEGRQVTTLKTAWNHALKRAGIERRIRLYDLRHWYASTLISGGADIKAASELMGHSSPMTTLKTYYHLMERQKRQALDHLEIPTLELPKRTEKKPIADKHTGKQQSLKVPKNNEIK